LIWLCDVQVANWLKVQHFENKSAQSEGKTGKLRGFLCGTVLKALLQVIIPELILRHNIKTW